MYNQYFIKAIDAYPYSLGEAIEALNYALAYDGENPLIILLQGRVYAEQFKEYAEAIACYEEAIAIEPNCAQVYPHLAESLIQLEEYEKAAKIIEFGLGISGVNRPSLLILKGYIALRAGIAVRETQKALKAEICKGYSDYAEACIKSMSKRLGKVLKPKKKKKKHKKKKAK